MNSIPGDQNSERQLQRLAAQRHLYARAKRILGWQVVISGPLAVGIALLVLAAPALKSYAALWGLMVVVSDIAWLTPLQKRLRESAARIQELFDCDVLRLPWDELKAGRRPDPEVVKEHSSKYETWAKRMPPLVNWYPREVGSLPLHLARVACQRSNCWWDAKQRRRYASVVLFAALGTFLVLLLLAMVGGLTIQDFILKVMAPAAPALLLGFRQFSEQTEVANRLDRLKEHSENLWAEAITGAKEADVATKARRLQDELLETRMRSPPVFDAVFKRLRREYEAQMNHGVSELVAEARQALNFK